MNIDNSILLTLITVAFPVLAAVGVDLSAWGKARENDPAATFNWPLALGRWIGGLCLGLTSAGLVRGLGLG